MCKEQLCIPKLDPGLVELGAVIGRCRISHVIPTRVAVRNRNENLFESANDRGRRCVKKSKNHDQLYLRLIRTKELLQREVDQGGEEPTVLLLLCSVKSGNSVLLGGLYKN